MSKVESDSFSAGDLSGSINRLWNVPEVLGVVSSLSSLMESSGVSVLSAGRNRVVRVDAVRGDWTGRLAVKSFGRRSLLRDLIDDKRGTRARRTFDTACAMVERKVGTPEPVCYLERWRGKVLVESYYVSVFEEGAVCFKDELVRLFSEKQECALFMDLMKTVAEGIASMHEAGVMHCDLGNQNILLQQRGEGWHDVKFMDLNRSRRCESLTLDQRARDISRIYLPSDLLRVFLDMYFKGDVPPGAFKRKESCYRRAFKWHTKTRCWRHPLRTAANRLRSGKDESSYPLERDMWIWDSRSAQPISVMRSRDKRRWYPMSRHLGVAKSALRAYSDVKRAYAELLPTAYSRSLDMKGKFAVGLGFDSGNDDMELALLEELGDVPVLVRLHAHDAEGLARKAALIKKLHSEGREVTVALLQDRQSVMDAGSWDKFVAAAADLIKGSVHAVEAGHAINRVKWGLWDLRDYAAIAASVKKHFGGGVNVKIMGPAAIDFEYPFITAALDQLPEDFRFDALSHHLYVDRRGAPENMQSGYATLEKAALLRAVAKTNSRLRDRVVVSEVNWPILGTGVWSPVNSPYESPGERHNDPSVSEDDYADFMIRYLLTCICSGMVDQVFWWRLVARGFGLVDDTEPGGWRKRPAFLMLKQFLKMMDGAKFVDRKQLGQAGGVCMTFTASGGSEFTLCYSEKEGVEVELPFECARILDAFGKDIECGERLKLSGRPVYCRRASF